MGKQNNNQRYLCRDCKKTFTVGEDKRKKYSEEFKLETMKWYLENTGIRSLERRLHISNTTIIRWIKEFGKIIKDKIRNNLDNLPDDLKVLKDKKEIEILEGDENKDQMLENESLLSFDNSYLQFPEGNSNIYKKKLRNGGEDIWIWIFADRKTMTEY